MPSWNTRHLSFNLGWIGSIKATDSSVHFNVSNHEYVEKTRSEKTEWFDMVLFPSNPHCWKARGKLKIGAKVDCISTQSTYTNLEGKEKKVLVIKELIIESQGTIPRINPSTPAKSKPIEEVKTRFQLNQEARLHQTQLDI